ncbi:MAG: Cof-type HAD-IIB family hydrolase [Treponema sp.]|nr:Cof-type HAD-IIB family hydrolase [Treponema sp.]MCL2237675.1 Cof-type HAD-IIB family hydrolase [Treponema sp.]
MSRNYEPKLIKALAIDLDGTTLLPGGILGKRTRDCLRKLVAKGMQIIISTGRPIESSEKYRSAIGAEGPMVFFNGAEVAYVPSGITLHTDCISMDVVDFGTDIARDLGIHYQVYLPAGISPDTGKNDPNQLWEALVTEKDSPDAQYYKSHTGVTPVIRDLKKIAALPIDGCIKGMYIADPSLHDEVRKRMQERFGDSITIMRSFPTFLEVINAGVSKGEGLRIAMEHRGLKPEEVIAFGDEENDLPMFTVAGFAAAPESAREKIRDSADLIYGPIAEEGLAEYLEKTFL